MYIKIVKACAYILFTCCLNSCQGQAADSGRDCIANYKRAKLAFDKYYITNQDSLLITCISFAEKAMRCPKARKQSIELKISALIHLKNYRRSYLFIDSLSDSDFDKKYEKRVSYDYIRGEEAMATRDTLQQNKYFQDAEATIQNYIDSEANVKAVPDTVAYFDLFVIKQKLLSPQKIALEIANLKQKYHSLASFFENLNNTIHAIPGGISSTSKPTQ